MIIQMTAAGVGGVELGVASIDVPMNGAMISVAWSGRAVLNLDTEVSQAQLGFSSADNLAVNDSRSAISNFLLGQVNTVTAAGIIIVGDNYFHHLPSIPVAAGERIFLSISGSAGVTSRYFCMVAFDFETDRALARRR